jgi:fatty acyl-CoA reductase
MEAFYRDKTIFLTGATGFVGKAIVEKIMRSLPTVRRVLVLVRAKDALSPADRLEAEVVRSDIFRTLDKRMGGTCRPFVRSKLLALGGDVTLDGLGLSPADLELVRREA